MAGNVYDEFDNMGAPEGDPFNLDPNTVAQRPQGQPVQPQQVVQQPPAQSNPTVVQPPVQEAPMQYAQQPLVQPQVPPQQTYVAPPVQPQYQPAPNPMQPAEPVQYYQQPPQGYGAPLQNAPQPQGFGQAAHGTSVQNPQGTAVGKPIDWNAVFGDFGADYNGIPGVVVGEVGTTVSRFPIDRIKFTTAKRERIAFLTNNAVIVKMHYIDGIGGVMCFGGSCCKYGDAPKVRYLLPVVVYDTDKAGRITSTQVELKVLSVGQDTYDSIVLMREASGGDLTSIDVIVICSDEGYQKITMQAIGRVSWKQQPAVAQYVADEFMRVKSHLTECIAKSLTEKEFMDRIRQKQAEAAQAGPKVIGDDVSLDDVFGNKPFGGQ